MTISIIEAINNSRIFGPFFRGPTWDVWKVFLIALFALSMTPEQLAIYQKYTGRKSPPSSLLHEAWLVIGRRGGKSFILAVIAVYLACFRDWRPFLGPGERGTIMIICVDRRQARVIKRFISGLLSEVEMLRPMIESETEDRIDLKNRITIEIHTASFRSTRGYLIIAALLDEVAYLADENSAEPDVEIINAIKPGMATVPDAMLLCASSSVFAQGRVVVGASKTLRQGRRPCAGLAGRYQKYEFFGAAKFHRRAHGRRPCARLRRIPGAVSERSRRLRFA